MKIPCRKLPAQGVVSNYAFDLEKDPKQEHPDSGSGAGETNRTVDEKRMEQNDCPVEIYKR